MANLDDGASKEAFGRAVRRFRAGKMTQGQLAEAVKAALGRPTKYAKQSVISAVETGKENVDIEDVIAFASAVGVTPVQMLIAWAEELDAVSDAIPGWLHQRMNVLQALDALSVAVRTATESFYDLSGDRPDVKKEIAAAVNELLFMPERERKLVLRIAGMLNDRKDADEARRLESLRREVTKFGMEKKR